MQLKSNYILNQSIDGDCACSCLTKEAKREKGKKRQREMEIILFDGKWYLSGSWKNNARWELPATGTLKGKNRHWTSNSWNSSSDLFSQKLLTRMRMRGRRSSKEKDCRWMFLVELALGLFSFRWLFVPFRVWFGQAEKILSIFLSTALQNTFQRPPTRLTASNFFLIPFHLHSIAIALSQGLSAARTWNLFSFGSKQTSNTKKIWL